MSAPSPLLDEVPVRAAAALALLAATVLDAPRAALVLRGSEARPFIQGHALSPDFDAAAAADLLRVLSSFPEEPVRIDDVRRHPDLDAALALKALGAVALACVPLVLAVGAVRGLIVVVDAVPRVWSEKDSRLLSAVAATAVETLEPWIGPAHRGPASAAAARVSREVEVERERLRDVLLQAPSLVALLVGPTHIFEFVNPPYERAVGRDAATLLGRPVRAARPALLGQDVLVILDAVYQTGQPYRVTEAPVRLDRHGDGTEEDAFFDLVYQPLRDARGVVRGVLLNGIETTTRVAERRRDHALAAAAETAQTWLRQVIEVLPEGVQVVNAHGRMVMHNSAARALLGPDPQGTGGGDGPTALRRLDGTPSAARDLPLQRALAAGEVVRGAQMLVRRDDGEELPLLMNSAPLRDAAGAVTGAVLVFQDITTIRNFEKARDALLTTVTHDLRNPLTAIQGLAEVSQQQAARGSTPSSERMATRQGGIVTAATQMTALLNELLDVMQLEMGQQLALDLQETDLRALVRRVVDHQQEIVDHPLVVDASDEALVCRVDADRIERVVGNLVSNAVKYSTRGDAVTLRLARDADDPSWVILSVADQGRGIPSEDAPHVFERFYRAENTEGVQGLGVGLASVREIVEQHGGTIDLRSQEGTGTTVTVRLSLDGPPPS